MTSRWATSVCVLRASGWRTSEDAKVIPQQAGLLASTSLSPHGVAKPSVPQFPHLFSGHDSNADLMGLLGGFNEMPDAGDIPAGLALEGHWVLALGINN